MNSEVYKSKVDIPDELLARILDAAASIKKCEDQLRRTTRDLRTRVAKCTEVDGGIFELKQFCQFCVINSSSKHSIKTEIKLTSSLSLLPFI